MKDIKLNILGIRHHGPGSSRNLLQALSEIRPDIILIEGPPEANLLLDSVLPKNLTPPVALIVYDETEPEKAVFYPFAEFSPEFQALFWANQHKTPVQFADLPQNLKPVAANKTEQKIKRDPFRLLTAAAGFSDTEKWWEHFVEKKNAVSQTFHAILEMIAEIRDFEPENDPETLLRESFMRFKIAAAAKAGFQNIVFVCGAWHSAALTTWQQNEKEDAQKFKKLPKSKLAATWIPWTYQKLAFESGYGAGVQSPRWYDLIWKNKEKAHEFFMIEAANLLRKNGLDTSPAAVIEAVKLAEMLTHLRNMHIAGIEELRDAAKSVLCAGSEEPFALIEEELIVGKIIGKVGDAVPLIPLRQDFNRLIKSLRIPLKDSENLIALDLRNDLHRGKSVFLHRLKILQIPFGHIKPVFNSLGTFHEQWLFSWKPTAEIALIDASIWGSTVHSAAISFCMKKLKEAVDIAAVSQILEDILRAELKECLPHALQSLENASAMHADVLDLMRAVPPLVHISTYGNVRQTDTEQTEKTLFMLCERIFTALPAASAHLKEENAENIYKQIAAFNHALALWNKINNEWHKILKIMAFTDGISPVLSGQATRMLWDYGIISSDEMKKKVAFSLSYVEEPAQNALWLEGFIGENVLILLYDDDMLQIITAWTDGINEDNLSLILPMLRRIFSEIDVREREKLLKNICRFEVQKKDIFVDNEENWQTVKSFLTRFFPEN